MLRDSVAVRTRPRAMMTRRKSSHGFPFHSYMSLGLRLAATVIVQTGSKAGSMSKATVLA